MRTNHSIPCSSVGCSGVSPAPAPAVTRAPKSWRLLKLSRLLAFVNVTLGVATGVLVSLDATAQTGLEVLHGFASQKGPAYPDSSLIQATDGNFYGTTDSGGASGFGTVFKMTPDGTVSVLHEFIGGPTDGAYPLAALIQATDGNFYGTTAYGGTSDVGTIAGDGTVFKMTPSGTVTVLHAFTAGNDGARPYAPLIQATDGNFYGTTWGLPGTSSCGTVFKMTPGGALTVLHVFTCYPDGGFPAAALIQATDGDFYGTTYDGGADFVGTVFRLTPTGTFSVLHAFAGGSDGRAPTSALIQATDGNFYGTTNLGGPSDAGTVFRMTSGGAVTVLHAFASGSDGQDPSSALIQATDGNFYGTMPSGGDGACEDGCGTVFKMTPGGTVTILHAFAGGSDGRFPFSALIQATDGNLYGTAKLGGPWDAGTVFQMSPSGTLTILHTFRSGTAPPSDFDGDGKSDVVVYRQSNGAWYILESSTNFTGFVYYAWGQPGDVPIQGDFDGDGKADVVVYRPSTGEWFIHRSSDGGLTHTSWGASASSGLGDIPVPGDYDGDGKTDVAIYRQSTGEWFIDRSSDGGLTYVSWGAPAPAGLGDIPLPDDYDGDGKADFAIYRTSTGEWFIHRSSDGGLTHAGWGAAASSGLGDIAVPGDYDGDGKADVAVYRASTGEWFIHRSSDGGLTHASWGAAASSGLGDSPVPGDYDGDGRIDPAVYRPSTGQWFILKSSTTYTTSFVVAWGSSTDTPINRRP